MKTRAEDQRAAMQEALEMLRQGGTADAEETLRAALEAPNSDVSARDAALEEAANELRLRGDAAKELGHPKIADTYRNAEHYIRALQSAPVQVVSKAEVREALDFIVSEAGCSDVVREAKRRIGVDLDATEERPVPNCGHVNAHDGLCTHPSNTTPECHPSACPLIPAKT